MGPKGTNCLDVCLIGEFPDRENTSMYCMQLHVPAVIPRDGKRQHPVSAGGYFGEVRSFCQPGDGCYGCSWVTFVHDIGLCYPRGRTDTLIVLQAWQLPYYCDAGSPSETQHFGDSRQQSMRLVNKQFSMKCLRVSGACARTVPVCTGVAVCAGRLAVRRTRECDILPLHCSFLGCGATPMKASLTDCRVHVE